MGTITTPSSEARTRCFRTTICGWARASGTRHRRQAGRSISSKIISTQASASSSCRAPLSETRNTPPPEHQGDRTRSITPNLGFKPDSSLAEFFRQHLIRPLGRPADDRGDAAAIFEQTTLVLWLEPNVRETGEMQHRPEAIASIREVVAGSYGTRGRIQTAENHVEASAEDIRFISDQATRPSAGPARRYAASTGNSARVSSKKALGLPLDRHGCASCR